LCDLRSGEQTPLEALVDGLFYEIRLETICDAVPHRPAWGRHRDVADPGLVIDIAMVKHAGIPLLVAARSPAVGAGVGHGAG